MRKIKFRAWYKEKKIMLQVDELLNLWSQYDKSSKFYREPDVIVVNQNYIAPDLKLVVGKKCELMQYTGLKDKKRTKKYPQGQEMYEGDIVLKGNPGLCRWKAKVIFESYGFKTIDENGYKQSLNNNSYYEIIGNIYKNPKLLRSK